MVNTVSIHILLQVEDRHCMKVPVVREGLDITLSKCNVEYNDNECLEIVLTLPRQACPSKVSLKH